MAEQFSDFPPLLYISNKYQSVSQSNLQAMKKTITAFILLSFAISHINTVICGKHIVNDESNETATYLEKQPAKKQKADKPIVSKTNLRFTVKGITFTMVHVEGGSFQMGSESNQDNEKPVHTVSLSDYHIGQTEVTQALWTAVMGSNHSNNKGDNLPVDNVSWNDCIDFIKKLNAITGASFRLPTEAEWEFAARGGNASKGFVYSGSNNIDEVAWYAENSADATHPVAQKKANELGLYDMSGNVYEWCNDIYGKSYYESSPEHNPQGADNGSSRVLRGGCYYNNADNCSVSFRNDFYPNRAYINDGLRLAL